MNRSAQLVCTYCGYVFVVVFCIGFVGFAGFVPPPSPAAGAEEIAAFFLSKTGPLAWNGIITFWLPVAAAVLWLTITTAMTARAVKRQRPDPLVEFSQADAEVLTQRIAALEARLDSRPDARLDA